MIIGIQGQTGLNPSIITTAVDFVVRDGKRWKRYPLNLTKDLNRIKFLLKRSTQTREDFTDLAIKEMTPARISGWDGWNESDRRALIGSDFAEVVALMEYWSLWNYSSELLQLVAGKK